MNSPSDTPRTDAMIDSCGDYEKAYHYRGRFAEFARSLERDLATGQHVVIPADKLAELEAEIKRQQAAIEGMAKDAEDAAKYRVINTPEIHDFIQAVEREALHQRERWGSDHDAGKTDSDWFWLVGYLAGKALNKPEKALHHIITTAAACLNWHAHKMGASTSMRPGIGPDKQPPKPQEPDAAIASQEQTK